LWLVAGEYGVPKRWYFLFTKSYWCSTYSSGDGGGLVHQNIELEFNGEGNFYFSGAYIFVELLEDFDYDLLLSIDRLMINCVIYCKKI